MFWRQCLHTKCILWFQCSCINDAPLNKVCRKQCTGNLFYNKNTHCFEWKSKVCAKFVGFRGLTRWIEITWFRIPVNNIVTDKQLHLVRCWEHRKIMRTKQQFFYIFFIMKLEKTTARKRRDRRMMKMEKRENVSWWKEKS